MEAREFQVLCFRKPTWGSEALFYFLGMPISAKGLVYLFLSFVILYVAFLSPIGSMSLGPFQLICLVAAFIVAIFALSPWYFFTPDTFLGLALRYLGKRKVVRE